MFGKHSKLEKRLAAGELRRASAFVVKRHFLGSTSELSGGSDPVGHYRVHVRVEPPGEEPFEESLSFNATSLGLVPHEGGRIPVAYDAGDRGAIIWDEATARTAAAEKAATDRERRDRIAQERRDAGLPPVELSGPDPGVEAKLSELQARKDRGELNDWEFRVARSEVMKDAGF